MLITVVDFGLVRLDTEQEDASLEISLDRLLEEMTVVAIEIPPKLVPTVSADDERASWLATCPSTTVLLEWLSITDGIWPRVSVTLVNKPFDICACGLLLTIMKLMVPLLLADDMGRVVRNDETCDEPFVVTGLLTDVKETMLLPPEDICALDIPPAADPDVNIPTLPPVSLLVTVPAWVTTAVAIVLFMLPLICGKS